MTREKFERALEEPGLRQLLEAEARKRGVRDDDDIQDVIQETLLAAVQTWETYREEASLSTWLVSILRHKISDHVRTEASRRKEKKAASDYVSRATGVSDSGPEDDDWQAQLLSSNDVDPDPEPTRSPRKKGKGSGTVHDPVNVPSSASPPNIDVFLPQGKEIPAGEGPARAPRRRLPALLQILPDPTDYAKDSPADYAEGTEIRHSVYEALKPLPPVIRHVLWAVFVEDRTWTEVADELGKDVKTLKTTVRKYLPELQARLAKLDPRTPRLKRD